MERRAFLSGLIGVAGAVALASAAQAAPLARTLGAREPDLAEGLQSILDGKTPGGMTPDGTPVEQAQVSVQIGPGPARRRYRRYRRRRSRMVCRMQRWRGRWVRRCRRVFY